MKKSISLLSLLTFCASEQAILTTGTRNGAFTRQSPPYLYSDIELFDASYESDVTTATQSLSNWKRYIASAKCMSVTEVSQVSGLKLPSKKRKAFDWTNLSQSLQKASASDQIFRYVHLNTVFVVNLKHWRFFRQSVLVTSIRTYKIINCIEKQTEWLQSCEEMF